MANGRKLFREYAQSKGKEAKEFVGIEEQMYELDDLYTKDNNGVVEQTSINYKNMVHWMFKNYKIIKKG